MKIKDVVRPYRAIREARSIAESQQVVIAGLTRRIEDLVAEIKHKDELLAQAYFRQPNGTFGRKGEIPAQLKLN